MRIFTSDNQPLDFCEDCTPNENDAIAEYQASDLEGPDGRGDCFSYDAEHPDYESDLYFCDGCGEQLKWFD